MNFDVAEHCGLDSAVGEIDPAFVWGLSVLRVAVTVLDLREWKIHRMKIPVRRQEINRRSTGIAEFKQLGDLVEGFSGSIVTGVANVAVGPAAVFLFSEVQVSVPATDHQRKHRERKVMLAALALLQQHSMDMSFKVVDGNEGLLHRESEALGVTESDQQRARQAGALGNGDGVDALVGLAGIVQRFAYDGHDGTKVLARGEFRNDSTVRQMGRDL